MHCEQCEEEKASNAHGLDLGRRVLRQELNQGAGRGQLVGRRKVWSSSFWTKKVARWSLKVETGSKVPRREGKSLQMARLSGKRGLGGKRPVTHNQN